MNTFFSDIIEVYPTLPFENPKVKMVFLMLSQLVFVFTLSAMSTPSQKVDESCSWDFVVYWPCSCPGVQ